jgi:hypothetical protein
MQASAYLQRDPSHALDPKFMQMKIGYDEDTIIGAVKQILS